MSADKINKKRQNHQQLSAKIRGWYENITLEALPDFFQWLTPIVFGAVEALIYLQSDGLRPRFAAQARARAADTLKPFRARLKRGFFSVKIKRETKQLNFIPLSISPFKRI